MNNNPSSWCSTPAPGRTNSAREGKHHQPNRSNKNPTKNDHHAGHTSPTQNDAPSWRPTRRGTALPPTRRVEPAEPTSPTRANQNAHYESPAPRCIHGTQECHNTSQKLGNIPCAIHPPRRQGRDHGSIKTRACSNNPTPPTPPPPWKSALNIWPHISGSYGANNLLPPVFLTSPPKKEKY